VRVAATPGTYPALPRVLHEGGDVCLRVLLLRGEGAVPQPGPRAALQGEGLRAGRAPSVGEPWESRE
jgi:hypothetical protein